MHRIHAVQMISGPDLETNLRQLDAQLRQLPPSSPPQLVVLPECFAIYGGSERLQLSHAEHPDGGPLQHILSEMARRYRIWLVAGTIPLRLPGSDTISAACLVIDDHGTIQGRYDKIHMFDVELPDQSHTYRESEITQPGSQWLVVDTPFGRLGLGICYDVRFPELFRAMGQVELIALPAAFTRLTGSAHWHTLLRARAIENQCYLVAAAQDGVHPNGRQTYGHSLIVNPWGEVIAERDHGPGLVSAKLDLELLKSLRTKMPVYQHRRLSCALDPAR